MDKQNSTAIYMWVSTATQKIDLQQDVLHFYTERAGLSIVKEYFDVVVSGRKTAGWPQLKALMKAARNHEFECIIRLFQANFRPRYSVVPSRFFY